METSRPSGDLGRGRIYAGGHVRSGGRFALRRQTIGAGRRVRVGGDDGELHVGEGVRIPGGGGGAEELAAGDGGDGATVEVGRVEAAESPGFAMNCRPTVQAQDRRPTVQPNLTTGPLTVQQSAISP